MLVELKPIIAIGGPPKAPPAAKPAAALPSICKTNDPPVAVKKHLLTVREVSVDSYENILKIIKIAKLWKDKASAKHLALKTLNTTDDKENKMLGILLDNLNINGYIVQCLESPYSLSHFFDSIHVCEGDNETIQALMFTNACDQEIILKDQIIKQRVLKIFLFVTNPDNIRSKINASVATKVTGAGTAMMKNIFKRAVNGKFQAVFFNSYIGSTKFYERFSFIPCEGRFKTDTTQPMYLDVAKIIQYIKLQAWGYEGLQISPTGEVI